MIRSAPNLPEVELIHVTALRHAGGHTLWLRFSDGVEGFADLSVHLHGPAFRRIRDPRVFRRVRLLDGYTAAWPGDVDIAPETLYELTVPSGRVEKRDLARAFDDAKAEYAVQADRMPEISRFFGIIIRMFYTEHERPHFHARSGRNTATVRISDGMIRTHGFPPRALRLVQEWRKLHRRELLENWKRLRAHKDPHPIPPLK